MFPIGSLFLAMSYNNGSTLQGNGMEARFAHALPGVEVASCGVLVASAAGSTVVAHIGKSNRAVLCPLHRNEAVDACT